jgi:hypothetical protein
MRKLRLRSEDDVIWPYSSAVVGWRQKSIFQTIVQCSLTITELKQLW